MKFLSALIVPLFAFMANSFAPSNVKADQTWLRFNQSQQTITITDLFNAKQTQTVHYTHSGNQWKVAKQDLPTGVKSYTITINQNTATVSEQNATGTTRNQVAYATTHNTYSTDAQ